MPRNLSRQIVIWVSMKNMKPFFFFFLVSISTSCGAANDAPGNTSSLPPTDSLVAGIPVYPAFRNIEPLFRYNNDTTYVINFWATWCKPCVEELPYFQALHEAYEGQPVKVVLVSLDFPQKLESKLVPFVEERRLQPLVVALLDGRYNDWIDKVSAEWTGAIPATLIYRGGDRNFVGQAVHSLEELRAEVEVIYQP